MVGIGSDVAELHGLGSESTPTTGVGLRHGVAGTMVVIRERLCELLSY